MSKPLLHRKGVAVLFLVAFLVANGCVRADGSGTTTSDSTSRRTPAALATERIRGGDRYATAAAISKAAFSPGVAVVYVATGTAAPDALAGGPASAKGGGPILLVGRDAVPDPTATELDRLQPRRIVVLGGRGAVSDAVVAELQRRSGAPVARVAGADRYATAAAVSAAAFDAGTATAYVANGAGFADALAAGPAAGSRQGPLLLVTKDTIPSSTRDELRRLHPAQLRVLGGPGAISPEVEAALRADTGASVVRVAGDDRYATSAAVAADAFSPGVPLVLLSTGLDFPDALAGGPMGALAPGPILLVQTHCVPAAVNAEIDRLGPSRIVILGGTAAVGPEVESRSPCPGPVTPNAARPCGLTATPPARYDHVVIVLFENKRYSSVIGSPDAPYATHLARDLCGSSPAWADAGSEFPSLPNYLALTSGNTPIHTDCSPGPGCDTTIDNVFRQVRAAGGSAKSYEETMPSNCRLTNTGTYAVRHNPAAYYVGGDDRAACQSDDVPYSQFDPDHLPTLAFVTPDLEDDTHDASVAQGDDWAKSNIARILDGADYAAGRTAVLWLWDEDTPIPNVVIAPSVPQGRSVASASHSGALRAVEEMLGLPLLDGAARADSIRGPFNL
jgi:putative cell wall-binding protein